MKKVFGQTVRDLKRGVNRKVLKVHSIEQKVLDATSNEPWGPHGTHLADIAQASRNYHEYQKIMTVVWKRLNDTGKNWRHVFKALTVLEYLVANGSERVIEDIREHAYQISTLSAFQYIDSTGSDQGSNVRKKSQSLVALVNDKEKIQEAREKAGADRDKLRNTPGDDGYQGRYGEDQCGRDGYKDDEYRGRSTDGYRDGDNGPRSRSSDRYREQPFEDDGHNSSSVSNARVDDGSPDVRLELKSSGKNLGAPPSYEDAVSEGHSPDTPLPASNHQETVVSDNFAAPPPPAAATSPPAADKPLEVVDTPPPAPAVTSVNEIDVFDFFDPRGTSPAAPVAPPASGGAEMDLLDSLSDSISSNALVVVPSEPHPPTNPNPSQTVVASSPASQPFDDPFGEDPFGDGPFKAVPSTNGFSAQTSTTPFSEATPFGESTPFGEPIPFGEPTPFGEAPQSVALTTGMEFGDTFDQTIDILADILPLTGPSPTIPSQNGFQLQHGQLSSQNTFHSQTAQPSQTDYALAQPGQLSTQTVVHSQMGQPSQQTDYAPKPDQPSSQKVFPSQPNQTTFPSSFPGQFGQPMPQPSFPAQGSQSALQLGFLEQVGQSASHPGFPAQSGQSALQPSFPAQGGQSPLQPGFQAQGVQSAFQPGFLGQGPQSAFQPGFPVQGGQSVLEPGFLVQGGQSPLQPGFLVQGGQTALHPSFPPQGGQSPLQPGFPAQSGQTALQSSFPAQGGQSTEQAGFPTQGGQPGFASGQNASVGGFSSQLGAVTQAEFSNSNGQTGQQNNFYGGFQPQGSSAPVPPLSKITATQAPQYNASSFYQPPPVTASTGALAIVPSQQPTKEKFETKSTVWADTLNRGLVNLNISGSKTNPLDDIGIDFEAINRKEKRMEKPSKTPVTSTITMGKAMGSGSGMGRAGAGALRPAPNPVIGSGMGINMGAPGYGGVNQPMGMNGMPQNVGVGMNIGQAFQMQQPPAVGFTPGSAMPPGSYNPMMGRGGGYGQQSYGGYR